MKKYYIRLKYNDDEYNIKCFRYLESLGFESCGVSLKIYLENARINFLASARRNFLARKLEAPVFITIEGVIYTTSTPFDEIQEEYTEIKFNDNLSMDIE